MVSKVPYTITWIHFWIAVPNDKGFIFAGDQNTVDSLERNHHPDTESQIISDISVVSKSAKILLFKQSLHKCFHLHVGFDFS